jgi:hypothetical protein
MRFDPCAEEASRGPDNAFGIRDAAGWRALEVAMTARTFYRTVMKTSHQDDRQLVKRRLLHALRARLTTAEADRSSPSFRPT